MSLVVLCYKILPSWWKVTEQPSSDMWMEETDEWNAFFFLVREEREAWTDGKGPFVRERNIKTLLWFKKNKIISIS